MSRGGGINLIFFSFYLAIAYPCRRALLHPSGDERRILCTTTYQTCFFSTRLRLFSAGAFLCLPPHSNISGSCYGSGRKQRLTHIWPIEREKKRVESISAFGKSLRLLRLLVMDDRGRRNRGGGGKGGPFLPFDTNSSTMGRCTDTKRARGEKKETRGEDPIVRERSRVLLQ